MNHDSFQPGWHPGIGRNFSSKSEYEAYKKCHSLIELGNDSAKQSNTNKGTMFTEDDLREIKKDLGISSDDFGAVVGINDSLLSKVPDAS